MENTTTFSRFLLPGFGLPLNFKPSAKSWKKEPSGEGKDLFSNALDTDDLEGGWTSLRLTPLREFTMLHIMNQLTDKPDWHVKVFDDDIASKWKAEALVADGQDVTQKMVDWCIAELRYKAKLFKETGAVSVYDADVVKSDSAISPDLNKALRDAVRVLEDVPSRVKDWHPGSDETVLDLVHPSLFPLVYGRSRILENEVVTLEDCIKRTGDGKIIPVPSDEETQYKRKQTYDWRRRETTKPFSKQFQWLPCDIDLLDNGKDVRITSYINNLHPVKYRDLYSVLERIIAHAIPLWNQTLNPMKARYVRLERIKYTRCEYDPDPEGGPEEDGPQQEDGEDDDAYWERREQWYRDTRVVAKPEPGEFHPPTCPRHMQNQYFDENGNPKPECTVDIFRDYKHRGLQVIVKLANVHLTPENPEYAGGTWHVEGQLNEHICASAVYYYDTENTTTSRLAFRQQVTHDADSNIAYQQDHHEWLSDVFGCEQYGPCIQEVGSVVTSEGRLLTWPNVLQHQVQSFRLADPTKPGHRKILALFLVDPHIRVISTANVPSQRADWWAEAIREDQNAVSKLPRELQSQIFSDVEDFPISLEDAKELRLKLMDERRTYVEGMDRAFQQYEFSLCEH